MSFALQGEGIRAKAAVRRERGKPRTPHGRTVQVGEGVLDEGDELRVGRGAARFSESLEGQHGARSAAISAHTAPALSAWIVLCCSAGRDPVCGPGQALRVNPGRGRHARGVARACPHRRTSQWPCIACEAASMWQKAS